MDGQTDGQTFALIYKTNGCLWRSDTIRPLPYFTSHPSILPNSIYGPQVLSLRLLRLNQSIAVHFDFVLKRMVPISLFRFVCVPPPPWPVDHRSFWFCAETNGADLLISLRVCVLESLSSLFLLCIFSHSFNYTCLLINLECSSFERVGFFEVFWFSMCAHKSSQWVLNIFQK